MIVKQSIVFKKILRVLKNPFALFRVECWGIGIVKDYSEIDVIVGREMTNISWFDTDNMGDFYADPFITDYFGEPVLFFEKFIDKEACGNISYISLLDAQSDNPYIRTALSLRTHLSYPYLFEYGGALYMVPENHQSHTISLYRAGVSPDQWEKIATLVDNFDGVDTNIFEYNGRWWMFSTLRTVGTSSENGELYIWHSDTPLDGWIPHRMNPFTYFEPIARCGGKPFVINGKLYRPAQDCTRTYGGELLIKEITVLTSDEFHEETVRKHSGYPPFQNAIHTFNCCDSMSVIDGVRIKYSLFHGLYLFVNTIRGKF